ncbi:uncharacterized protein LOC101892839 [Musca domestica]|uniref:Uncharacterized protein LOC101892839 n=1 Tax=Musca domestica TaxID=7370 RepID=A0A1I8M5P0_MUSDO|nr:uncharacterized protein LOC101892839 [Musca domestica]
MKYEAIFIFVIFVSAAVVNADLTPEKHLLAESVIREEANYVDRECFDQVKDEFMRELIEVIDKYIERVENGGIVYKKGIRLNVNRFIQKTLLKKSVVNASKECIQKVKDVFKVILKRRYGRFIKTIDPYF